MMGKIHSIQSLGTLDGPGVRFVVFLQGCNLRCSCCHNPDTWAINGGTEYTAEQIVQKAVRFKEYFGKDGGITFSGGEPLLQTDFVREVFEMCHHVGINTCLDTSGAVLNENVKAMLTHTDRVLLDIKYTDPRSYLAYVGCDIEKPLRFLDYLSSKNIPTTIRHVIVPTLNDNRESIVKLGQIISEHNCVDKTELLPFRKICTVKYTQMGIDFPFAAIPEPSRELMERLERILNTNDKK